MARTTLNDLVHLAGRSASRLGRGSSEVRVDPHVQADETSFRTQVRPERSFVWTFLSQLHTVYVYSASRSGDTPKEVLGGTTGTLTVDGYTGYNNVTDVDGRERTGCWSHARRKLFEALPTAPEAREGLDIILDLFMVERSAKNHGIVGTRGAPGAAAASQPGGAQAAGRLEGADHAAVRAEERDGAGPWLHDRISGSG